VVRGPWATAPQANERSAASAVRVRVMGEAPCEGTLSAGRPRERTPLRAVSAEARRGGPRNSGRGRENLCPGGWARGTCILAARSGARSRGATDVQEPDGAGAGRGG